MTRAVSVEADEVSAYKRAAGTLMVRDLPRSTSVVIIGGGIMGASTLWHLADAGYTDVVLVERDVLASGSTSKASGGMRAQFSDPLNARIGLAAIDRYSQFADKFGIDIGFRQSGYLYLLTDERDVALFDADLAQQTAINLGTVRLGPDDVAELVPGLYTDDVLAANWRAGDACAIPEAAVQAYVTAAAQAGARIIQSCPVTAIQVDRGAVVGVETKFGTIATDTVVMTAGVWSRELAASVGVDIPVSPLVKHVFYAEGDTLPREIPLITDYAPRFYIHRDGRGLLLGGRETTIDELAPTAVHRVPQLAHVGIRGSWFGAYEMSPDNNAIIGRLDEPAGLLYATGFSGHGFMQAPVVGEHLAQLVLGQKPTFDLSPLSLDRFASGGIRAELHVV